MIQADFRRRLARTRELMERAELDGLLVSSQYNRRYLTGFSHTDGDITESAGWALVTSQALYLITGTFFLTSLEHEVEPSGAKVLLTDDTPAHKVLARTLVDQGIHRLGFEKEWLSYGAYARIHTVVDAATTLVPADDLVEHVRIRKDAAEIAVMRRAAHIANRAFAQLVTEIRAGMTERRIAFRLEDLMRQMGASEPSFPTIVASGPGGALPHAVPTEREPRPGEPLLIDFGCRVDGYCSDLTRTICLGEPDPKLVEIYAHVRAAQDAGEDALRTGIRRGRDVDLRARQVIKDAGYEKAFFHSLGHGVGMAVHELPLLSSPRTEDAELEAELAKIEGIEASSVVTVEPGIYLADWGGVRLEDMVLVTADGLELFTDRNPEHILSVGGE